MASYIARRKQLRYSRRASMVLLLGLISRFPKNELRVATIAPKRLRIDNDSVTMSKNALGIWYESRTNFRIGEFVAKVLTSTKLLSRIPDRPTNRHFYPQSELLIADN